MRSSLRCAGATLACLALLAIVVPAGSGEKPPAFALIPPDVVAGLRFTEDGPAVQRVLRSADLAAARAPHPLRRVHTEGTLPHQGIYDESEAAVRDWAAMRDLGLAFAMTRRNVYARSLDRYFGAWLDTYRVSFNPIDETGLDSVIVAYDFVRGSAPADVSRKISAFLWDLALGYLRVQPEPRRMTTMNNWQSHRVKLITLSAFALGDPVLVARAQRAFRTQLDSNLRPDGSTLDFELRDALHYVVYDLEPLVMAALAASEHGLDWYDLTSDGGASLRTALQWLEPYARGERLHEEFAHTSVEFDRIREAAGLRGFSGVWEPHGSTALYQMAARLDPGWTDLATRLGHPGDWLGLCFPR